MPINVFEGARRIAKLFALLGVVVYVVVLIVATNHRPWIGYEITSPGSPPTRTDTPCRSDDISNYLFGVQTQKSGRINVNLCFRAKPFDDGEKLIPYKIDRVTGRVWLNRSYSDDVDLKLTRFHGHLNL